MVWILILTSLSLGAEPAESSLPRPKLVVGIVVDQMRWDYPLPLLRPLWRPWIQTLAERRVYM